MPIQEIGEGAYGKAYRGRLIGANSDKDDVVIKMIKVKEYDKSAKHIAAEIAINAVTGHVENVHSNVKALLEKIGAAEKNAIGTARHEVCD